MITYNEIYNDLTYHKDGMIYRVEQGSNTVYVLKNEGFNIISITDHNTCQAYDDIADCKDIKIITFA